MPETDSLQPDETQPESPTYRDLSSFLAFKQGDAAADDAELAAPEPAAVLASDGEAAVDSAPETPEPAETPEQVSEAARTLSARANETKRERRIRQINEEIAGYKAQETEAKTKTEAAKAAAAAEEERLVNLRAERARLEAQPPTPAAQPAPVAASPDRPVPPRTEDVGTGKMPDWDAFQTAQAKFVTDMAEWSTKEAGRIARETVEGERRRAAGESIVQTWNARVSEVEKQHPDFKSVVFQNPKLVVSDELAAVMHRDPDGPAVAYYLGTHTEEALRIAHLPPLDQAAEFGRLAKSLSLPVTPPKKDTGPAPSAKPAKTFLPTPPVGPASVSSQVPTERKTLRQFMTERNAAEAESRGL